MGSSYTQEFTVLQSQHNTHNISVRISCVYLGSEQTCEVDLGHHLGAPVAAVPVVVDVRGLDQVVALGAGESVVHVDADVAPTPRG